MTGTTKDGTDVEVPVIYVGNALPSYNSGSVTLATPDETLELDVDTRMSYVFDPEANTWTRLSDTSSNRILAELAPLDDRRAPVVGGFASPMSSMTLIYVVETYDLDTGEWQIVESMNETAMERTLLAMRDGRVMAVGGFNELSQSETNQAEIFDPAVNRWSPGPELSQPRARHSATLMPDGRVLLAGGISQKGERYPVVAATEFVES